MIEKIRNFCGSFVFAMVVFLLAAAVTLFRVEAAGVLVFVALISVLLFLCSDVTVTTLPFLLMCMFVVKCYDSFHTFIRFAPFAVIPIAALLFHFIFYRRKFSIGPSFYGICAVAVAVMLGGAFIISPEEYFSPTSLFYMAGLGIGMVGVYLLLKSAFTEKPGYDIRKRFAALFYIAGLFGCFMLFSHYILNPGDFLQIQWSNNLSTMMMFFLPAPFYFALTGNRLHILSGLLFYVVLFLTGSRGGILMGCIELLLCLLYVAVYDKILRFSSIAIVLAGIVLAIVFRDKLFSVITYNETGQIISEQEARYDLMFRAIDDFKANPIFGRGFGYTGNTDYYNPVKGAANWYHMMIAQVIGSFGLVGCVAYLFQFIGRVRLIFRKRITCFKLMIGLSYAGILLMSMVNPGEFCPIPYEMLTVLLFIFLELPEKQDGDETESRAFLRCGT